MQSIVDSRQSTVVAVGLLGMLLAPGVAQAQTESDVPEVRYALVLSGRGNFGEFGDQFERGWLWGFEAGWQPGRLGVAWSIGWSVPQWTAVALGGSFENGDPMAVDATVGLMEMSIGPRLRWPLGEENPRFLLGNAGVTMMRATIPIPPDSSREYIGPFAGIGYEQLLFGRYMVGIEARYGMIAGGPAGLTFNMSLAFGSR